MAAEERFVEMRSTDALRGRKCVPSPRIFWLPISAAVVPFISIWITYAIAVSYGHVQPFFPYISYTAINVPGRGVFGQLINISAVLIGLTMYVRYLQLREHVGHYSRLNTAGLVLGLISAFGLSMVANFQTKVMRPPHFIGASLGFGIGTVNCIVQTIITWKIRDLTRQTLIKWLQTVNTCFTTAFCLIFAVTKIYYHVNKKSWELEDTTSHPVYIISSFSEWLLAFSMLIFMITFVPEFRRIEYTGPQVKYSATDSNEDDPVVIISATNEGLQK